MFGQKDLIKAWFVLFVSIILVFVLFECYLRVSGKYYILRVGNELDYFCQYDPLLGWVNKPQAYGFMDTGKNIVTEIKINRYGMRDQEYGFAKLAGIKRIAVLGDSFTFGLGVEKEQIFTEVLKKELGKRYEVLNFGVGGYGVGQEYLLLKEKAVLFEPDIVLCAFYVGNDFFETSSSCVAGYEKPLFKIKEGKLFLTNVPPPRKKIWYSTNGKLSILIKKFLRNNFYSYGFIVDRLKILIYQVRKRTASSDLSIEDISSDGQTISTTGIFDPDDPANEDLYRLVEKIVLETKLFCDQGGIDFCLVIIPAYWQLQNNNNYPQRKLSDFCLREDIYVIDLFPFLKEQSRHSSEPIYYEHDPHFTKHGHTVAAQIICEHLHKFRLVEKRQ